MNKGSFIVKPIKTFGTIWNWNLVPKSNTHPTLAKLNAQEYKLNGLEDISLELK